MTALKITYTDKTNKNEIADRTQQATAEDFNEIKTVVNETVDSVVDLAWTPQQFGALADGITDDTAAIQSAINNGGKVYFPKATYRFGNIDINNATVVDCGESIFTSVGGEEVYFFNIKSDDVTINGGNFGTGIEDVGMVAIGDSVDYIQYSNIIIQNTKSDLAITNDKGCVRIYNAKNVSVLNNIFTHSGGVNELNMAVGINVDPTSVESNRLNISILNNAIYNYTRAIRNYMVGYYSDLFIGHNYIEGGGMSLDTYHVFNSKVFNNKIVGNSSPIYLWSRGNYTDNDIIDSTGTSAVLLEALSGTFSGNRIYNADGIALLIDGGNSDGLVSNNFITKAGSHGISINPGYNYGGEVNSLRIIDNFIQASYGSSIYIEASEVIRTIYIQGNNMNASGYNNASPQAAIYLLGTNAISALTIKSNIITTSDQVSGYQGNSSHAFYIDGSGSSVNYWFMDNYTVVANAIFDGRAGGLGYAVAVNNRVSDLASFTMSGTDFKANNYSNETIERPTLHQVLGAGDTTDRSMDIGLLGSTNIMQTNPFSDPSIALKASDEVDTVGFVGISYATAIAGNTGFTLGALRGTGTPRGKFSLKYHDFSSVGTELLSVDGWTKFAKFEGLVSVGSDVPTLATDTGVAGTITYDASYIYVCVATDTWKRIAIATW